MLFIFSNKAMYYLFPIAVASFIKFIYCDELTGENVCTVPVE